MSLLRAERSFAPSSMGEFAAEESLLDEDEDDDDDDDKSGDEGASFSSFAPSAECADEGPPCVAFDVLLLLLPGGDKGPLPEPDVN